VALSLCDAAVHCLGREGTKQHTDRVLLKSAQLLKSSCEGRWCLHTVMCPYLHKPKCTGWADISRVDPTQGKDGGRVLWGEMAADEK